MSASAADVVGFWEGAGPEKWYAKSDAFDQEIRDGFLETWEAACAGELRDWMDTGQGCLGRIILLDQFPRNMFRNDPRAYCTDGLALETSEVMIENGWDADVPEPMRQFVFMPFMHSETLEHLDTCIALMETRMSEGTNALHARVHREIVNRFGRFPYRNPPLGRKNTAEEQAFLDQGGYAAILKEMQD